jgi:hypothetical protein
MASGHCKSKNDRCTLLHGDEADDEKNQLRIERDSRQYSAKLPADCVLANFLGELANRSCLIYSRRMEDVVQTLKAQPCLVLGANTDADIVSSVDACCISVHSTAGFCLETANSCTLEFGCIYLDYSWPLDRFQRARGRLQAAHDAPSACGLDTDDLRRKQVSDMLNWKLEDTDDGFQDIRRIFGLITTDEAEAAPLLSKNGAVVAVTIVQPNIEEQKQVLKSILDEAAKANNHKIVQVGYAGSRELMIAIYAIDMAPWNIERAYRVSRDSCGAFKWLLPRKHV